MMISASELEMLLLGIISLALLFLIFSIHDAVCNKKFGNNLFVSSPEIWTVNRRTESDS